MKKNCEFRKTPDIKIKLAVYLIIAAFCVFCPGVMSEEAKIADNQPQQQAAQEKAPVAQPEKKTSTLDVLDLKSMEVSDMIKLISQKSGLNIFASKTVQGKVTIYLRNIDVLEALRIIVDSNGWAFEQEKDVIKVMTAAEYEAKYGVKFGQEAKTRIIQLIHVSAKDMEGILNQIKSVGGKVVVDNKSQSLILMDNAKKIEEMMAVIAKVDLPVKTEVFQLNYALADDISGKITEALTPDLGKIKFDLRTNRIIVSDTESKIKQIGELIKVFDHKDKEVLIQAKIVQIILSDETKLGVDWKAIVNDFHRMKLTNSFSNIVDTEKQGELSVGTINKDDYEVILDALQTVGTTDILSSPHITTVNNKEARILVGATEPYVTTTTTYPTTGPAVNTETVNFIEVGVKLYVTPTINDDGFITMKIKPEVSAVTDTVQTSNNNKIPVVETSEAETTVMVKDGITIIIGGLIKEEKIKTTKKVPLLGDIPLLGIAFRNKDDSVRKTELVIFLTPHIITGDVSITEM
ncbi:MAG: hypothetical protein HQL27_01375 [Candidatus Omnitrophica bacterium]|nr:hypothetical protein [Candidatus Omnitrophota bacterium]